MMVITWLDVAVRPAASVVVMAKPLPVNTSAIILS